MRQSEVIIYRGEGRGWNVKSIRLKTKIIIGRYQARVILLMYELIDGAAAAYVIGYASPILILTN